YLGMLTQGTAVGGFVLFSVVTSWLFGREYADRTAKDLLALPTSRSAIVMAKLVVLGVWAPALAAAGYALTLGIGSAIGLPQWSQAVAGYSLLNLMGTALLTVSLVAPVALVASAGRGYLPPVGFALLAMFLAQIVAAIGWGAYFPWSVPALYS